MPIQVFSSFIFFAFISSITPGPANLVTFATAIQYGKKSAFHQWFGLEAGYFFDTVVSVLIVFFLGASFTKYVKMLTFVGVAYMIYLAIHMLRQNYSDDQKTVKEPGFLRGILVQLTNVKVIITIITCLSSYVLPYYQDFGHIFLFSLFLPLIGPSCPLVWLFAGSWLQKFFVKHQMIVNIVMAILLLLCAVSLVVFFFTA